MIAARVAMTPHPGKVGFIGLGPVGTAFAVRLAEAQYRVAAAYDLVQEAKERFATLLPDCRLCQSAQELADVADLVFVTTPDDVIPKVVEQLRWYPGQTVVHCSGASSTVVLEPARQQGAGVGSIHPCQTFAGVEQAIENLPGSTFALEAIGPVVGTLKDIVTALGGNWLELGQEDKPLYHAASAIVCNYLCTVVKVGTDLWQHFGMSTDEATRAYMPILRATVDNIGTIGLPGCLTGPIARGDVGTIRKHLEVLQKRTPEVLELYRVLGLATIPIARAKGTIDENRAEQLRALLAPE